MLNGFVKTKRYLKPCPFCGRTNIKIYKFHEKCYSAGCYCGCEAPGNSVGIKGAQRIWNKRKYYAKEKYYANSY